MVGIGLTGRSILDWALSPWEMKTPIGNGFWNEVPARNLRERLQSDRGRAGALGPASQMVCGQTFQLHSLPYNAC